MFSFFVFIYSFYFLESRSIFRWTRERLAEYQTFNPDNPNQSSCTTSQPKSSYNPQGGLVMRALHFLETQVLTNTPPPKTSNVSQSHYDDLAIIDSSTIQSNLKENEDDIGYIATTSTSSKQSLRSRQWLSENVKLENTMAKLKYDLYLARESLKSDK